jgi:predicted transcriptional regulator
MAAGGMNATSLVSFRVPPHYAQLVDRLALELNVSTAALLRRAVEHFAQNVAADDIGSDLPDRLVAIGQTIRTYPRPSRRAGRPSTTAGEG